MTPSGQRSRMLGSIRHAFQAAPQQLSRCFQPGSVERSGLELEFGEAHKASTNASISAVLASSISISTVPLKADFSQESR
jgi:hypothetical protein